VATAAEPRIVGRSLAHRRVLEQLGKASPTDAEILISGPSGVGKELYARYAHAHSPRGLRPFVPVCCGALPAGLFENELFGHIGGAFTGARPSALGLVNEAEGGTLFLDEVDTLEPACQVKILRLLQEREYRRLGEARLRRADVRIIAATNANLLQAAGDGTFRADLLFRLRVVPVDVPPLCERRDDIRPLLDEYVARVAQAYHRQPISFSDDALASLQSYDWPGNVRELENCVRYLTCLGLTRDVEADDLTLVDFRSGGEPTPDAGRQPFKEAKRHVVDQFERRYVEQALARSHGRVTAAARASGKDRRAFFELMRKHGVRPGPFRDFE
jgi:DNA-binding NtrC family response regulator